MPAAARVDDVDAPRAVPVLAERQLAGLRAPPARVHGRVLEQQQQVGQRVVLAGDAQALLQLERLAVLDGAELADPQLVAHGPDDARAARAHRASPSRSAAARRRIGFIARQRASTAACPATGIAITRPRISETITSMNAGNSGSSTSSGNSAPAVASMIWRQALLEVADGRGERRVVPHRDPQLRGAQRLRGGELAPRLVEHGLAPLGHAQRGEVDLVQRLLGETQRDLLDGLDHHRLAGGEVVHERALRDAGALGHPTRGHASRTRPPRGTPPPRRGSPRASRPAAPRASWRGRGGACVVSSII